jgi:hypothetical protein
MEKPRILISCNSSALVLAEKLQQALERTPSEPVLWSEEGGSQSSVMTIQMLEEAAGEFDFAVMILTRGDVAGREVADMQKVREASAFRAGLFIATIGRNRCFLIHSVEQPDLPAHLNGIVSIPFEEPANLAADGACEEVIARVVGRIVEEIHSQGRSPYRMRVPTMSMEDVWQRERPRSEGGELRGGDVVVCDTQPIPDEELATQIRRNLDSGIAYTYFLYFSADTIEKVIQCLQVILASGSGRMPDFNERISRIKTEKVRILEDFRSICRDRRLRIAFFPDEPQFMFRVHNASSRELATVYVRYRDKGFIEWVRGSVAEALWRSLPRYLADDEQVRLFIPLIGVRPDEELFNRTLDRALALYFPGIEDSVKQICVGAR